MVDIHTTSGLAKMYSMLLAATKYQMEESGKCAVCFLFSEDIDVEPVSIPAPSPFDENGKRAWFQSIREEVVKTKPLAVFFACEAIKTMVNSNHPEGLSQEVIHAVLEHRNFETLQWESNVLRGDSIKTKCTSFWQRPNDMKGYAEVLVNLLK